MAATSARRSLWPLAGYAVLTAVALARRRSHPSRGRRIPPSEQTAAAPQLRQTLTRDETPAAHAAPAAPAAATEDLSWWGLVKRAAAQWIEHMDARLGAALAYYSVFS